MVYLVSYKMDSLPIDLVFNYRGIVDELQKSNGWAHHIDNTWLIYTQESIEDLYNRLRVHFRTNERILIIPVDLARGYQGWLPQEAWDWIESVKRIGA